jgi:hypothetical protein
MSQSSETTNLPELLRLGYPEQRCANQYYTARVNETHGVCVAPMTNAVFIQFFPWGEPLMSSADHGHGRYAAFICRQASTLDEKYKDLPYFKTSLDADLLTIKCLIEEGIKQLGATTDENDQASCVDAPAGKAVE